ncbi:SurA N-terminal domain-containing protein [Xanthobacter versatilis]|uniref:Putative peptidyl-prolyl cis-trans isomerase SurA n=1 Tax=Xanthobacter autotrophicus (strain ATCC BAA-1158 / Py2) TaxID=78245 RepID=A7IJ82_XANP2|nr:putative peptidyl-prolyl cis-trans isomerase SurA [Xanthobacter autotrophicus Py2]
MLLRHFLLTALALAFLALGAGAPAQAQQIIVMVNGDPITTFDVSQRQLMHQMIERKSVSAQQALEDLIDERIKIQQAIRLKMEVEQKDVDRLYASVAERSGRTPEQLTEGFKQQGLNDRTFKQKLFADYVWGQYVRARSGTVNVRDADVVAALQKRGETQMIATEYTLMPIVFVVPRNAGNYAARLAEANALRGRFTDCDAGAQTVKSLKEVVVRPKVTRLSSEMPPQLRQILDKTEIGRLTPPEVAQSGVETFAICGKREVRGESAQKKEIKDELSNAQFAAESKKFMAELRKQSLIEYRRH